jgi:tRNA modification GTPase
MTQHQRDYGDTVFALSSGPPVSGVAVIRISGTRSAEAMEKLAGDVPVPRVASLRRLHDRNGDFLDTALAFYFPGPASFTGEDCAELHVHGGRAVISAVLGALLEIPGLRPAEAGEFTKRAFLSGKLDLTEAEALADLLAAETDAQRRFALNNGSGRHALLYGGWRTRLLEARARIEAYLDFSEEEDVSAVDAGDLVEEIAAMRREIQSHIDTFRQAEIIRSGLRVVILGAPNAGKSSLLNALAARDVAIVSEEAGTTRDLVEVALDIDGMKIVLTDTAGIREDTGTVERMGIERALRQAEEADLVLLLEDMAAPFPVIAPPGKQVLRVGSKADLAPPPDGKEYDFTVSAADGRGLPELLRHLAAEALENAPRTELLPFRPRHVGALTRCADHLELAVAELPAEMRAEQLRLAADELARLTGAIDTEEILGSIFSTFCIGK